MLLIAILSLTPFSIGDVTGSHRFVIGGVPVLGGVPVIEGVPLLGGVPVIEGVPLLV